MSGIFDWIIEMMKLTEDDGPDITSTERNNVNKRKMFFKPESKKEIFINYLDSLNETKHVIEKYKEGCICVVRLDNCDGISKELVDYLSGAIFALEGKILKVSENVLLIVDDD